MWKNRIFLEPMTDHWVRWNVASHSLLGHWRVKVMPMGTTACEPEKHSLFPLCDQEVLRHKWIESQKVGYDLGEVAINQWVQMHWMGYLRARWVEHLQGKCFWAELHQCDFGLLQRKFHDRPELLDAILDQLKAGKENLDVLRWACENHIAPDPVLEILEALDVNSSRLQHRFDRDSK
jgi:hypothetical protein